MNRDKQKSKVPSGGFVGREIGVKGMKNNKWYRFFTSIPLAITLLSIIAVLCILCTLIPQNESGTFYTDTYGEFIASLIRFFGFDHILNSFLLYLTGMVFAVNLGLCTGKRFVWAISCSRKGMRWDVWGSPILHVGLCLILMGAVFSIGMGRQIYYEIPVGKTAKVSGHSGIFTLQVNEFTIDYYEDQLSPKQYRSKMTVKDGNGATKNLLTQVNSPAKYDGVSIIQQAYGWQIKITLRTNAASRQIELKDNEWVHLFGEGKDKISLGVAFYPDYAEIEGKPMLLSNQDNHPHILWVITKGEIPVATDVLALGEEMEIFEALGISFDDYGYYTGLQIKYDPGIPIIFSGFFLVCMGLMMRYILVKKTEEVKGEFHHDNNNGKS